MRRLGCRDGPNRSLRRTLWRRRLRRRLNRSLGWRPQRLRLRSYDLSGTFRLGLLRLDRTPPPGCVARSSRILFSGFCGSAAFGLIIGRGARFAAGVMVRSVSLAATTPLPANSPDLAVAAIVGRP